MNPTTILHNLSLADPTTREILARYDEGSDWQRQCENWLQWCAILALQGVAIQSEGTA